MQQLSVTLIASNRTAFPAGSQVVGQAERGLLTKLAGYDVEDITYSHVRQQVNVRTALGCHFTISTADYNQLVAT